MRIRVLERRGFPENCRAAQFFDDERVGFLHEHSADERHVRGKFAALIHWLKECELVALSGRVVVGAERRRHVHHARSIFCRDEIFRDDHFVRALVERDPVERTTVVHSDESDPRILPTVSQRSV